MSRTLVLVTAQNEILDILNPQQQQKLQERIIREVAIYWRYQRLAHTSPTGLHTKSSTSTPSLSSTPEGIAPPTSLIFLPTQTLAFLDRAFAELESKSTVVMILSKRSWTIVRKVTNQFQAQPHSSAFVGTVDAKKHSFKIQALIWAAINYFFGNHSEKPTLAPTPTPGFRKLLADSKTSRKMLGHHRSLAAEGPWLTLGDLFGELEPEDQPSQQIPMLLNQKKSQVARRTIALLSSKLFTPVLTRTRKTAKAAVTTTPSLAATFPLQPKSAEEICSQYCSQGMQHESAPEWIETYATAMGYVKHPLEQLLEWLDRLMLWLEEVLMIVWRWIRSFTQSCK